MQLNVIKDNTRIFGIPKTLVDDVLVEEGLDTPNNKTRLIRADAEGKAREIFLAMMFMQSTDKQRF